MHWTGILLYGVVICWLLPGVLISDTALVLAVSWAAAESYWWASGEQLPIWLYLPSDLICLAIIMWAGVGKDRLVAAIYPLQWALYWALSDEAVALWWSLYWLTLAQFVIAGPWVFFARNRTLEGRRGLLRGVS